MKFFTSWDWTMEVVYRIRKTATCLIDSDSKQKRYAFMICSLSLTTPIETVFQYAVNYIEWFNNEYKTK